MKTENETWAERSSGRLLQSSNEQLKSSTRQFIISKSPQPFPDLQIGEKLGSRHPKKPKLRMKQRTSPLTSSDKKDVKVDLASVTNSTFHKESRKADDSASLAQTTYPLKFSSNMKESSRKILASAKLGDLRITSQRPMSNLRPSGLSGFYIDTNRDVYSSLQSKSSYSHLPNSTSAKSRKQIVFPIKETKANFYKTFQTLKIEHPANQGEGSRSELEKISIFTPETQEFYRDLNTQMNNVVNQELERKREEERLKKKRNSIHLSVEDSSNYGETKGNQKKCPTLQEKISAYATGVKKQAKFPSQNSFEKLETRKSERFIGNKELPPLEFKQEEVKNEAKKTFVDLMAKYESILPSDDTLLKDLIAKVPGSFGDGPAGRKSASLVIDWMHSNIDKEGVASWNSAQLAVVEMARQCYMSCSERGEAIILALSAFKKGFDAKEKQRLQEVNKIISETKAQGEKLKTQAKQREEGLSIELALCIKENSDLKSRIDHLTSELESSKNMNEK